MVRCLRRWWPAWFVRRSGVSPIRRCGWYERLGIAGFIPGPAGVFLVVNGQPAGLILLALGAFSWAAIYLAVGGYLWADAERVGSTRLVERGSCRRGELAYMKIGLPFGRSGAPCFFIRKDGSVALRTAEAVWGEDQLRALAAYIQLPVLDARHPVRHICPVCGYTGLEEAASSRGIGSGELCPSCGFDFAGLADETRYSAWRAKWVQDGMRWWGTQAGLPAPADWNPAAQLKAMDVSA